MWVVICFCDSGIDFVSYYINNANLTRPDFASFYEFSFWFLTTVYLFFIETKKKLPPSCCRSLTNFITLCCNEYTSPLARFELTMLVVIGTDCMDSYKYNSLHRLTSVYTIKVFGQSFGWKICSKITLS